VPREGRGIPPPTGRAVPVTKITAHSAVYCFPVTAPSSPAVRFMSILQELRAAERWPSFFTGHSNLDFKNEPMRVRMPRRKPAIRPVALSVPKKPIQWEVYRPIKGSPGAFIGIVEAPDETSALKAAIKEFGIINPEQQNRLFVRRVPSDDD